MNANNGDDDDDDDVSQYIAMSNNEKAFCDYLSLSVSIRGIFAVCMCLCTCMCIRMFTKVIHFV